MPMHLSHLQSDDNHHDASSASPRVSHATLEMYSIERDADDYDIDDGEMHDQSEDQHHDAS